jgi:hypothetical protein
MDYLSVTEPKAGILPLNYLGRLSDVPTRDGEVAEYWSGPCGANIIHIRPEGEAHWASYAVAIQKTQGAVPTIPLPAYLAHQTHTSTLSQLEMLDAKRIDSTTLPPCKGWKWLNDIFGWVSAMRFWG